MGLEFKINEELANIAVTSTELYSASQNILKYARQQDFKKLFGSIIAEVSKSYTVVNDSFTPFAKLTDEASFIQNFDSYLASFSKVYLMEISKPRNYIENVYEPCVELKTTKDAQSKFPLLKYHYARWAVLYDKQMDNDIYLAMSIDRVIKLQNQLLLQIAELKTKDPEDAFLMLSSAWKDFSDYLQIIRVNSEKIIALHKE